MKKLNITPEPWEVGYDNDTGPRDDYFVEWHTAGPAKVDKADDASLIADAGNTYHATGLLPSEMAERIKALEEAGDQMVTAIYGALYNDKEGDEYPEVSEAIMPTANAWYKMRLEQTKPPIDEALGQALSNPE